jgi:hypothetical protein
VVRWDSECDFIRVTASGVCTAPEQFSAVRVAASESPRPGHGFRMLFDGRDLADNSASPSSEILQSYAQRIAELGYRRFALVVPTSRIDISEVLALHCSANGIDTKVFVGDLAPAQSWLLRVA